MPISLLKEIKLIALELDKIFRNGNFENLILSPLERDKKIIKKAYSTLEEVQRIYLQPLLDEEERKQQKKEEIKALEEKFRKQKEEEDQRRIQAEAQKQALEEKLRKQQEEENQRKAKVEAKKNILRKEISDLRGRQNYFIAQANKLDVQNKNYADSIASLGRLKESTSPYNNADFYNIVSSQGDYRELIRENQKRENN